MQIIAIMNYKGGVGKTTLTANLAAEVANRGHRVLMIDLDPQANLTFSFYSVEWWREELRKGTTIMRWYEGDMPGREVDLHDLIVTPPLVNEQIAETGGRVDLISSHLKLIDIDLRLAARLGAGTTLGESKRKFLDLHGCLARALRDEAFGEYDLVLIDCAPNFGLVTKTAIVASDHVLVPAKADYLSTLGIQYLAGNCDELVAEYNDYVNHGAAKSGDDRTIMTRFIGVVFTMVKFHAKKPIGTQRYYMEDVRLNNDIPVLNGMIRDSPRHFGDAGESGVPAILRAPVTDDVVVEFRALATEILDAASVGVSRHRAGPAPTPGAAGDGVDPGVRGRRGTARPAAVRWRTRRTYARRVVAGPAPEPVDASMSTSWHPYPRPAGGTGSGTVIRAYHDRDAG